jgi:hypothetical protein
VTFTFHAKRGFHSAWFSGAAPATPGVPHLWHVSLAGRGYILDLKANEYAHRTVPMLKQDLGADQAEPGEHSLNPEGPWRRSSSSWHGGAGQTHRDLADSTPTRFRTSKGVDVWTRGQLSLLAGTAEMHALTGGATAQIVSMGDYLYYCDDEDVVRTDGTTPTTCTGTPAADVLSLAASGSTVWAAYGASGVYSATGTTFSNVTTDDANLVGWAKGRILMADGKLLSDLSSGTPASVLDHADAGFEWTCIADGVGSIFAGGNSGNKALIYRIGITADGSALSAPVVAARLPDGELVHSMVGYLGTLILGTSQGFRLCAEADNGNLTMGPLIDLGVAVRCFATYGDSVWFGWSNYDATSTGCGRINLGYPFTDTLVPAYASDLMVTGQGTVDGLAFLGDDLAIGVAGDAIYEPSGTVSSGTVESGRISYGLSEEKIVRGGIVDFDGTVTMSISTDGGEYTTLDESGETERGRYHEWRLTLGTGATVRGVTLLAYPSPTRTRTITLPLILHSTVHTVAGTDVAFPVEQARLEIESLAATQRIVTYQEGARRFQVKVEDYVWAPYAPNLSGSWDGTMTIKVKEV